MLLDSASMYFRAFYGVPETMTAPDGTPVNAVRGLLDMMSRLVRARQPGRLVACLDAAWRPAFRTAAIPSYKAHRANPDGTEQVPDALTAQIPVILEVLAAAGVATAGAAGYEADDVIGTLAAREPGPVEVVTGDRDLFQVVDDERGVRVALHRQGPGQAGGGRRGRRHPALRDPRPVLRRVRGAARRPERRPARRQRGGGEDRGRAGPQVRLDRGMLAALDAGHGGFPMGSRAKLTADRAYLDACVPVVAVATDAPLPPVDGELPSRPADPVRLAELDERWDLGSSLGRLLSALAARPG